ncbi:uncharacterized protein LOC141617299 [Silene latifolia]|uniref:uncharacterized protein LOC141617299 n=1 Tax=Silene latifolia TaxID=37657 RepID=UPI003D78075E
MDLSLKAIQEEPSYLLLEMSIPWNINQVLSMVSRAYLTNLSFAPFHMSGKIPALSRHLVPLTCMVWNIQGNGNKNNINALKEVVKTDKPSIIALVETHMTGENALKIQKIIGYNGHSRVDANGFSGGIWLYWRPEFVTVTPVKEHSQYITIEISRNGELPWFFSAVYASPNPNNRVELWTELEQFARNNGHPWMLAGDFNETRSLSERHGGPAHTWALGNTEATRQSARLDRALCNSEWNTLFSDASVRHLPAYQSDHCPLLISPNGFAPLNSIQRPFRFQAAWMTHENFSEFIASNCSSNNGLVSKLSELSTNLQRWNEDVFGNIFRKKRELFARIEGCQRVLSARRQHHLIKLEARLRKELDTILEREELLWYQKSRVEFIRDGDRNTSYFQVSTLVRRWRNRINLLKNDEGVWVEDRDEIKSMVVDFYKRLYTDDTRDGEDADIPYDLFQEFNNEQWEGLSRYYSPAEIDNVVFNMGSLKAPGPDGFQALFYQKQWTIVKQDVYSMVMRALEGKGFPEGLNETHIVLILKVDSGCLSDRNFLPIPDDLLGATVAEMWDEGMGWKWDVFSNFLSREDLLKIAAYYLSPKTDMEGSLYWNASSSGKFTVKSALALIKSAEITPEAEPIAWHVIWKLPVQQRIRMFIWLAAHRRLMTNYNRVRRGIHDDPLCPRCREEDESTDHLLRNCPYSKEIWYLLGESAINPLFYTLPFQNWISKNASNALPLASHNWSMKFAITCWWIWRWRNNIVFGRAMDNPADPIPFLRHQFEVSRKALDPFSILIPIPGTVQKERFIRWNAPPHGWLLLNTDGASKGNPGPAGGGGIIRDETGNFCEAFKFSCGICSSMRAEMRALVIGLERARGIGVTKLLVHMDNATCVSFVEKEQLLSNGLRPLVQRCIDLIRLDGWTVKIDHVFREANRAADWLANEGITASPHVTYLEQPPDGLRTILREDILGVAFPRLVSS